MSENEFIIEGRAKIHKDKHVFYNPAQKFNRDITVSVINNYIKNKNNINIFEAMSATGLRGIRYVKEINEKCNIYLNDLDGCAIDAIKKNIKLNGIIENKTDQYLFQNKTIHLSQSDCNAFLYMNRNLFDIIDIDPFGSCTQYIDSAISNIKDGGLLCLTSTDTSVLCSNKRKCFIRYNTIITKIPACHEQSLRVLLSYVVQQAGKFEKSIEPILSISVDFYIRVFIIVKNKNFKKKISYLSYYSLCSCFNFKEHPIFEGNKNVKIGNDKCEVCDSKFSLVGPLYNKKMYNVDFVNDLLKFEPENRIIGILNLIKNEIDTFLFYSIPDVCHKLKKSCVPLIKLVSALLKKGFLVSLTHCKLNSIKTNCSVSILNELIFKYFDPKNDEDLSMFEPIDDAKNIIEGDYHKGLLFSNLGPLSRPTKE